MLQGAGCLAAIDTRCIALTQLNSTGRYGHQSASSQLSQQYAWYCLVNQLQTMRRTQKVFEMQEHAGGPLSPCQVWWGSDFTKTMSSLFVCLSVRHACGRQSLCARFRHEGVGIQKQF